MKLIILCLLLGSCASVSKEYCRTEGYRKVIEQAELFGVEVDKSTFERNGTTSNKLATWEWWRMEVVDYNDRDDLKKLGYKHIQMLTQKPPFGNCF